MKKTLSLSISKFTDSLQATKDDFEVVMSVLLLTTYKGKCLQFMSACIKEASHTQNNYTIITQTGKRFLIPKAD